MLDRISKIATIILAAILVIAAAITIPMWVGGVRSDVGHLQKDVDQLQNEIGQLRGDVAEIRILLELGGYKEAARDTGFGDVDGMSVISGQQDEGASVVWQWKSLRGVDQVQVGEEDVSE